MMLFMNFVSTTSPNLGSGMMSRLSALRRRDIVSFLDPSCEGPRPALAWPERPPCVPKRSLRPLGAVFRAPLAAIAYALGVEHAANNVIAHAGQVLDAAAPDQDHRVLLEVMPLARDIAGHFQPVGQAHARDLAQSRVRLLRRRRVDARA